MIGVKISHRIIMYVAAAMAAMSFVLPGEKDTKEGTLLIDISHRVGPLPLILDYGNYTNALSQPFTITKFKYYIGDIQLKKKDGSIYNSGEYFLVDEELPESKKLSLKDVPPGEYTSFSFLMGVDSLHNCSGAQTGALDEVNAMFWTWSTGYIFLKLEGHADASTSPGHIFEYHIGGYKEPSNCIRRITLALDKQHLQIGAHTEKTISLSADVSEILKNPTAIDFSKLSSVTDLHNATTIADNYLDLFSVESIK